MTGLRHLAFERLTTLLLVAVAMAGCFPSDSVYVTVWVDNDQSDGVLLRYIDSIEVVVLEVPPGYSGLGGEFASQNNGRVELLSADCATIDGPVAMPSNGAVLVQVEGERLAVSPTTNPNEIDEPELPESELCFSMTVPPIIRPSAAGQRAKPGLRFTLRTNS